MGEGGTHALDAVAALDGAGVAAPARGGRNGSEGEGGDGDDGGEHLGLRDNKTGEV